MRNPEDVALSWWKLAQAGRWHIDKKDRDFNKLYTQFCSRTMETLRTLERVVPQEDYIVVSYDNIVHDNEEQLEMKRV